MKKIGIFIVVLILVANLAFTFAYADEIKSNFRVEILSPNKVKDYPGLEETIKVKVTNNSNHDINDILVYITMADIKKNMTVNLEDYSADKPVYIDKLTSGKSQLVDLPIRFVYTSNYYLYVTAVSKENNIINSSSAIPIEIMGNTKINKSLAVGVAAIEPILLLSIVGLIYWLRKRKYKVK